jgi:hypothetical protein
LAERRSIGRVFITDGGCTARVLLTIEDYQKLVDSRASIVDLLAMPGAEDVEFCPPRLGAAHELRAACED